MFERKKSKHTHETSDVFDRLPDDIVISILCNLGSTSRRPSDFINILFTCKRLNRLALHPLVLSKAGPNTFAVRAQNWSDHANSFLKKCISACNIEASYILGMIRFYCLQNRDSGVSLMAKAAINSHAPALYSLALIHFNGSGGSTMKKDLRAGVALCRRAAYMGHIDARRELGHCLQDGYGVRQNVAEGRRLLFQANALDLACNLRSITPLSFSLLAMHSTNQRNDGLVTGSGFGFNVPEREVHPVNRFLVEWFGLRESGPTSYGLMMCSDSGCGRPETRRNEFRRCSSCGKVKYCSRGCQARDWKIRHKVECARMMEQWVDQDGGEGDPMVEVEADEERGTGAV